jgi:hypothetical protein
MNNVKTREEGYLTIATGEKKYFEYAVDLALSIKLNDPKRPICLLCDDKRNLSESRLLLFDYVIEQNEYDKFVGCSNKLSMYEYSPFERTIFFDADTLLVRDNIDFFWDKLENYSFTLQGHKKTFGMWGDLCLEKMIAELKLPYMITGPSAFIYFDKSQKARSVFKKIKEYYYNNRKTITWIHKNVNEQYADEPIICAAMCFNNMDPIPFYWEGNCMFVGPTGGTEFNVDVVNRKCSFFRGGYLCEPTAFNHSSIKSHFIYLREAYKLRKLYKINRDTLITTCLLLDGKLLAKILKNLCAKIIDKLSRRVE